MQAFEPTSTHAQSSFTHQQQQQDQLVDGSPQMLNQKTVSPEPTAPLPKQRSYSPSEEEEEEEDISSGSDFTPDGPGSSPVRESISKVFLQKANRPCVVCKANHVACDRQRPCLRCRKSGRERDCIGMNRLALRGLTKQRSSIC